MILSKKSDNVGMLVSTLCFIHCLITPFIFIAQSCTNVCCADTPVWWQVIDYFFLGISFLAIWFSTRSSKKQWVKIVLWINWVLLAFIILFEELANELTFDRIILLPAITLIAFHFYNKKYCCAEGCEAGNSASCKSDSYDSK